MVNPPIRILIVDDSAMMRKVVASLLAETARFVVVGEAANGVEALKLIADLEIDVVILDVNMPVMGGMTVLKHIMISQPLPVVMLSGMTQSGSRAAFDALRFGAVDFIAKPSGLGEESLGQQTQQIMAKILAAATVQLDRVKYIKAVPQAAGQLDTSLDFEKVVVLGGAEGAGAVLLKMMPQLSLTSPLAMIAIIHENAAHVAALAEYLDGYVPFGVRALQDGDLLQQGVCYLGAGDQYVTIEQEGAEQVLQVSPAPFHATGQRGAVDRLMFSAVELFQEDVVAVIISGSDNDGAEGLCEVQSSGGVTLVQTPDNCLHGLMSETAIAKCEPDFVVYDSELASTISSLLTN